MIEVSVYLNRVAYDKKAAVFRQCVNLVGVDIPYTSIMSTMRFIFGQSCVIEFILL